MSRSAGFIYTSYLMNLAQAYAFWLLLGGLYALIVGILHCISSLKPTLVKFGIAPLTLLISALLHLYSPTCVAVINMAFDFGYELKSGQTWTIVRFAISVFVLLFMLITPLLIILATVVRYGRVMKGGIWYFSNESFLFRGLRDKSFIAALYVPTEMIVKFLIPLMIIALRNEAYFISITLVTFFDLAYGFIAIPM